MPNQGEKRCKQARASCLDVFLPLSPGSPCSAGWGGLPWPQTRCGTRRPLRRRPRAAPAARAAAAARGSAHTPPRSQQPASNTPDMHPPGGPPRGRQRLGVSTLTSKPRPAAVHTCGGRSGGVAAHLPSAALEEAGHGHRGAHGGKRDLVQGGDLRPQMLHRSHKALHAPSLTQWGRPQNSACVGTGDSHEQKQQHQPSRAEAGALGGRSPWSWARGCGGARAGPWSAQTPARPAAWPW
jgi:hypothetical protein